MALSRRDRREQRRKLLKDERIEQLKRLEEHEKPQEKFSEHKGFLKIYDVHYKKFLIFTIALLVFALLSIGYKVATTGEFLNKGVSLSGGTVITIPVHQQVDINEIIKLLKNQFPNDEIEVRSISEFGVQKSIIITTDNTASEKEILDALSTQIPNAKEEASAETTGETLGAGFFKQTLIAMLIAFVFMALVVFISFKTFAPSMAVITCAFADIVETIAVVNLIGINISAAGIATFLMLIGYSVDTDILLTARVLKTKEGSVFQRILSAAKTGLLMTTTALVAVIISLIFTRSETIKEIMIIMLIGLIFDIINTWLQNTALLRFYVEHKNAKPVREAARAKAEKEQAEKKAKADKEEAVEDAIAEEVFEEAEKEELEEENKEKKENP